MARARGEDLLGTSESAGALTKATIERVGARGEGVATIAGHPVYVPHTLPGERVSIEHRGERGTLIGLIEPSPERIAPICPHAGICGGCAVQEWAPEPYAAWKRGLLVEALGRAGVAADVGPLVDAHGSGRRRATFHARIERDGRMRVGFMQARSHAIVPIEICPILDPRMAGALEAARAIAQALAASERPLDLVVAATQTGLDVDLRGHGPLGERDRARLLDLAMALGLARLSNHGVIVVEPKRPTLEIGAARVELPPGAFLQATTAGEAALAERVRAGTAGCRRVADLFCGIGTFALRLAEVADVLAIDSEPAALAALDRAGRATPGLRRITAQARDLFGRPLTPAELAGLEAVVLDPPRAGAEAQMRALAASDVARVVSVACDAQTFARDAAILTAAGFVAEQVDAIDQFRYSAHLEIVAAFRRPVRKRPRRLLG